MVSLRGLSAVTVLAAVTSIARAAALFEPPGTDIYFGAWLDTADGYNDRPWLLNQRLNLDVPVFQISQPIPRPAFNWVTGAGGPAPENLIELSNTTAAVYLTVYPNNGFGNVTTEDYTILAQQISAYQIENSRTVFLRYAPEMQGKWMPYGQQPSEFIASWIALHDIVKVVAPNTIMVWAPNTPQGYPYGQSWTDPVTSAANQALLDTNHNGVLDAGDDAFSPYWPGDQYVDWVGISIYYKGPASSDTINVAQTPGYCGAAINGTNPANGANITNWYTTYCEQKPNVACMFAECGAAYHVDDTDTGDATQLQLQTAWINDCITNTSMFEHFPRLKLIMAFEYEKVETANNGQPDLRDFRMTNNSEVRAVLEQGFSTASSYFSWASTRAPPTSVSTPGAAAPNTNSAGSTIQQAITQTTRPRPTTFPSLFGHISSAHQLVEFLELGVLVSCGLFGAWATMRWA